MPSSSEKPDNPIPLRFLAGGGEMGERMRALDWSATPLGPVDKWPQSLLSAASMLLPSKAQICMFWGPELAVVYNDAYRPVFGVKHPHVLGRPGREAWSEIWDKQLHPLLDGVVRTGEAFHASDLLFFLERHGFAEETYFDVSYDPVRGESGAVGGVFCIVTETTARVVGERRLALLRDLAARNATARTPREACALAMETLRDRADLPFALAYLGDELQAATPGAEAARAAAAAHLVKELPLASGRLVVGLHPQRPFDAQYESFLGLVADQVDTAIGNARAYEEEKRRSEALAELDRAKTAFFSNVSHEFRTPLTLMLAPLEDALAGELPAEQRARLEVAQRNAHRLLKLVNTLLDFSRIEAGRAAGAFVPVDLAAFTAELASQFRSACERAGLALEVDCPPLGEPVCVDPEMWEKIVFNLLSNAFKFTFEGGIAVRLRREGAAAVLEVRDTGTGIPAAELPHLFERFHRVEGARGRSQEGSGIGLALVRELAHLHKGEASVESEPGRGAVFRVSLPLGSAHLPPGRVGAARSVERSELRKRPYVDEVLGWLPPEEPQAPPARAAGGTRARILVADDNADMRRYLERLLGEHYDVTAVADGEAALAAATGPAAFDLVLTDVMMPKLDGFGLIAALRADERSRSLPVILLSARAGEESRVEGLEAGADDYLVKPFSAKELLARVASRLETTRIRREADRRKDEFLATLSHELRNPLAPLRNALHLMRMEMGAGNGAPVREIMERQVNHLVRLVDDLLELSRVTRGAFELRRERVELAVVVRNALETSDPLIKAARHRLDVSMPGEALWLEGDPVRLAQILSNLLNNAAKYTPEGGAIALSARCDGGEALISVRDNGSGIEPRNLSRIFEMFVREHPAEDAGAQGGLGIGLTLSRRLAEMHGGTIEAKSDGAGRGSEFVVRLPLSQPVVPVPARAPELRRLSSPMRILLVDDNEDAAASLGMVLKFMGAEVQVAHDGPGALEAFDKVRPSVVLLDIGLPGMDGYEVARRLRESYPERSAKLVALTGWGQEEDRRRAREAGFEHHLVKPAEIDTLQKLLADIEENSPRNRPGRS